MATCATPSPVCRASNTSIPTANLSHFEYRPRSASTVDLDQHFLDCANGAVLITNFVASPGKDIAVPRDPEDAVDLASPESEVASVQGELYQAPDGVVHLCNMSDDGELKRSEYGPQINNSHKDPLPPTKTSSDRSVAPSIANDIADYASDLEYEVVLCELEQEEQQNIDSLLVPKCSESVSVENTSPQSDKNAEGRQPYPVLPAPEPQSSPPEQTFKRPQEGTIALFLAGQKCHEEGIPQVRQCEDKVKAVWKQIVDLCERPKVQRQIKLMLQESPYRNLPKIYKVE
eukprot:Clim_evm8s150 gene=Clim_evmTU8s150